MLIQIKNTQDILTQVTFLTQQENAGTTTFHVKNAQGFAASQWAIQAGKTGEEKTETLVLTVGAPSGTTLSLATASVFDHPTDTPIYATKYDQVIFKRSTSGTSGAATAFATVQITPDQDFTQYDDTSGASTYAYKAAYYNSTLGSVSSDSDWLTPAGYDFYSLAKMRQRVKDKLFNATFIQSDQLIDDWLNEYLEMMTNAVIDVDEAYNMGSTNVSFSGTAELGTITASDFKQIERVWMTTDGGVTYYQAQKMKPNQFVPQQVWSASNPFFYMYGDTVIGRQPHDVSGTAAILYYKLNPVLVNETDNLPQPMRGYTNGFVEYALGQAYQKDNKPDVAQLHLNNAMVNLEKFKKESTPRSHTGPSYINIVESISDDYGIYN